MGQKAQINCKVGTIIKRVNFLHRDRFNPVLMTHFRRRENAVSA